MLKIFIDAQIWLSLYSFSKDDLEQFGKLKNCIKENEVEIILTEQVKKEVERNRENKLKDVLSQTKNISFSIPVLYQGYKSEYKTFSKSLSELQKLNDSIQQKINQDIANQTLPQDKLIKDLFKMSTYLPTNEDILKRSYQRFMIIGDPPGKDHKCGDSINWETLLNSDIDGDIFFISADKDYKSVLDENKINQYLLNEWRSVKKSNLFFYKSLSEFFNQHLKDIKLTTNKKQEELIADLYQSGSFNTTHTIVRKMLTYSDWSTDQVERICKIAKENNQVYQILYDPDVHELLTKLVDPLLFETTNEDIIDIQREIYKDFSGSPYKN